MNTIRPEPKVLVIVLAGGEGKRLAPLTADRAKPAVPFGGSYRIIDFVLSNFANARYLKIVILTQYKSHSLDRHITQTWRFSTLLGSYVTPVPAQMRRGPYWFSGSADAIYQNLNLISDERPDIVCVFGADHIYAMDPRQMVEHHLETGAGVTVAAIPVPKEQGPEFGVIESDASGKIIDFHEKSPSPPTMPGDDTRVLASMGNYVFTTSTLVDVVTPSSSSPAASSRARRSTSGATGAMSGRSTPTTGPTWTCSARCRRSASTTPSGRCTACSCPSRRPSSASAATAPMPASTTA
jgi:glucose-1-phosphate adenylyltransferase